MAPLSFYFGQESSSALCIDFWNSWSGCMKKVLIFISSNTLISQCFCLCESRVNTIDLNLKNDLAFIEGKV